MPDTQIAPCYRDEPEEWQQVTRGRGLFKDQEYEYPLVMLIKNGNEMVFAYAIQEEVFETHSVTHIGLSLAGDLGDLIVDDEVDIYRAMIDHRAEIYEIDIHGGTNNRRAMMRRASRVLTQDLLPTPGAFYSDFDERAMPARQKAA